MSKTIWWLLLVAAAGAGLALFYYVSQNKPPAYAPSRPLEAPAPKPPPEPEVKYPIEPQTPEKPLPALSQSDPAMKDALGDLWSGKTVSEFFNLEEFVRRVVATIDNLPRQKVAQRLMPLKPAPGQFGVEGTGDALSVGGENSKRYGAYVALVEAVDSGKLVSLYAKFYPLFQRAYEDLGYPKAYFNDRLVEVIDHLLAAPEMPRDVKLVQPKVFYQFADPDLEGLSAGQKIMMRMGNENAARIKSKLREIRRDLTRHGPKR